MFSCIFFFSRFSCDTFAFTFLAIFENIEYGLRVINRAGEIVKIGNAINEKCKNFSQFDSLDETLESLEDEKRKLFCRHGATNDFITTSSNQNAKYGWKAYKPQLNEQINHLMQCENR